MSNKIGPIYKSGVAKSTPFDNSTNGFVSTDVQAAIEELTLALATTATSTFSWGRSGTVSSGTWLQNETVPSNTAGRTIGMTSPTLERLFISNESVNTFDIEVYQHDGTTYTLLTTVSMVAQRANYFDFAPPIVCTTGKEMAVKISSGSCKNVIAVAILKGGI